jgi:hypothetical protein
MRKPQLRSPSLAGFAAIAQTVLAVHIIVGLPLAIAFAPLLAWFFGVVD